MAKFEIIDNFLPEQQFIQLKDLMLSKDMAWYFQDEMTYVGQKPSGDEYYFTHVFYIDGHPNSANYDLVRPLMDKIDAAAWIRVKGNLFPNFGRVIENDPHRDFEFENAGAVFSINTCNGFTRLEDGTKVDSVANRLVIFEGHTMHNSSHCSDQQRRVNINLNYIAKRMPGPSLFKD